MVVFFLLFVGILFTLLKLHQRVSQAPSSDLAFFLKEQDVHLETPNSAEEFVVSLRQQQKYNEAFSFLKNALKLYPTHANLWIQKGHLFNEQGDKERASRIFLHYQEDLKEVDAVVVGKLFYYLKDYERALEFISPFLDATQNKELLALAGDCYFFQKEQELSVVYYQKALDLGWVNQRVFNRIGYSLKSLKRYRQAAKFFRSVIEEDEKNLSALLGLGQCLQALKSYDQALALYHSSKLWEEKDKNLLKQAAQSAIHLSRYSEAEQYLKQAFALGHASAESAASIGLCLEMQRKWKGAEQWYSHLVEHFSEHSVGYRAMAWLSSIERSTLSKEEGLKMAQKALEILPDVISWELLSVCEMRAGNLTKAREIQEKISHQFKDYRSIQQSMGDLSVEKSA